MEDTKKIIYGKASVDGELYDAEIIDDVFVLRKEVFDKGLIAKIVKKIILFTSEAKGWPDYYLYIDKYLDVFYSGTSFKIQLLYKHFSNTKEVSFVIESKGFTNSINNSFDNDNDVLDFIQSNLEKRFLISDFSIEGKRYLSSFTNIGKRAQNNLCPIDFTSCLLLTPVDGVALDKIKAVYDFSLKLLQFITINTYPIIDEIRIVNSAGGYSVLEIYDDFSEVDRKNDRFLSIRPFENNISQLLECFPNGIARQYNLFHYKREWVFEFDIVRISGAFEDAFRENVEKSELYNAELSKRKEEISHKDLGRLLKDFCHAHNLGGNEDFDSCRQLFDNYGGTLKNKLEFALNDFCNTMGYTIIDDGFFYSPTLFETRLKDARNAICHGLHDKVIDWKNAANDTLILQEIIYFIILKYKMKLPPEQVRECLSISFGRLNERASFFKQDDPRAKRDD